MLTDTDCGAFTIITGRQFIVYQTCVITLTLKQLWAVFEGTVKGHTHAYYVLQNEFIKNI
jgi:hypothetical protein